MKGWIPPANRVAEIKRSLISRLHIEGDSHQWALLLVRVQEDEFAPSGQVTLRHANRAATATGVRVRMLGHLPRQGPSFGVVDSVCRALVSLPVLIVLCFSSSDGEGTVVFVDFDF